MNTNQRLESLIKGLIKGEIKQHCKGKDNVIADGQKSFANYVGRK